MPWLFVPVSRPELIILTLVTLLLAGCGTSRAFLERVEYGYESLPYQQEGLLPVDPEGDARLIRNLDRFPGKLYTYLFEGHLPQLYHMETLHKTAELMRKIF